MLMSFAATFSYLVSAVVSLKVLDFQRSFDDIEKEGISTATADLDIILPTNFVVCTSHYQKRINASQNSIFVLYEDEQFETRWFTVGLWEDAFWIEFNNATWIPFHRTPLLELKTWINLCVEINIVTRIFKLSVNGEDLQQGSTEYNFRESYNLHLKLGQTENSWVAPEKYQFVGMVRSLNIFSTKVLRNISLEKLSINPESYEKIADLLSWDDTNWNLYGSNVQWKEIEDDPLYSDVIKLPNLLTYKIARKGCKLLGGYISDISENENFARLNEMADNIDPFGFWIPYTDEVKEGDFVNYHTGDRIG